MMTYYNLLMTAALLTLLSMSLVVASPSDDSYYHDVDSPEYYEGVNYPNLQPPMQRRKVALNDFLRNRIAAAKGSSPSCTKWQGSCTRQENCCAGYYCRCNIFTSLCLCL